MIQINRRITNVVKPVLVYREQTVRRPPILKPTIGLSGATGGLLMPCSRQSSSIAPWEPLIPRREKTVPMLHPSRPSGLLERLWLVLDSLPERKASQGSLRRHSL